jgi:hypothetical protein
MLKIMLERGNGVSDIESLGSIACSDSVREVGLSPELPGE